MNGYLNPRLGCCECFESEEISCKAEASENEYAAKRMILTYVEIDKNSRN